MAEQLDFWPMMAPKSDPDIGLRDRWRFCLMLIAAASTSVIDHRALEKWVRSPDASAADLFTLLYYDRKDVKRAGDEALEFLIEKGLIDEPER